MSVSSLMQYVMPYEMANHRTFNSSTLLCFINDVGNTSLKISPPLALLSQIALHELVDL